MIPGTRRIRAVSSRPVPATSSGCSGIATYKGGRPADGQRTDGGRHVVLTTQEGNGHV